VFNHILTALGGYDGGSRLPTTEQYDMQRKDWRMFDEMNVGRSNFADRNKRGHVETLMPEN
jgi:hypothetical protein